MLSSSYSFFRFFTLVVVAFIALLTISPSVVSAADPVKRVLILNQVRGSECCDAGSLDAFKNQQRVLEDLQMPGVFAFRYDALGSDFTNSFNQRAFEPAAFLEITPQLASDADVDYTGNVENWYQAHHAYTLGYALDDRKRLIDAYMSRFKQRFGGYPLLVVSWMLDTPSANYLQDKYGVQAIEITREQWGTDSYTLSGGPVHYPYRASRNWLFVPSDQVDDTQSLVVFRQTNADPLYNYGDSTSAFTTQPNDYIRDGKGFDYFTKLASQLLSQSSEPYSFLLLGLENSMSEESQKAFAQQLQWVADQRSSGVAVVTTNSFLQEASRQGWLARSVSVVSGRDTIDDSATEQSFWIVTPHYRARLVRNGRSIAVTDIRAYSSELHDPYTTYAGQNNGFWVAPFLLDSSRFYSDAKSHASLRARVSLWLKRRFLPEYQQQFQEPKRPKNDLMTEPLALQLPRVSESHNERLQIAAEDHSYTLRYADEQNNTVVVTLAIDDITIAGHGVERHLTGQLQQLGSELPMMKHDEPAGLAWNDSSVTLEMHCSQSESCSLVPKITNSTAVEEYRNTQYAYVFPEVIDRQLSIKHSTFYAHTEYSIAGRNPARLVVLPKDEHGFRTQLTQEPRVTTEPPVSGISIKPQDGVTGLVFIDILESKPGAYIVSLSFDGSSTMQERIFLAPNCQKQRAYCFLHPMQASWFVAASFYDRLRSW